MITVKLTLKNHALILSEQPKGIHPTLPLKLENLRLSADQFSIKKNANPYL